MNSVFFVVCYSHYCIIHVTKCFPYIFSNKGVVFYDKYIDYAHNLGGFKLGIINDIFVPSLEELMSNSDFNLSLNAFISLKPKLETSSTEKFSGSPWPLSETDRKSTRLNSSHVRISYAVFCLKKKKKKKY